MKKFPMRLGEYPLRYGMRPSPQTGIGHSSINLKMLFGCQMNVASCILMRGSWLSEIVFQKIECLVKLHRIHAGKPRC